MVPAQPQCFLGNPIGRPSDFVDVYNENPPARSSCVKDTSVRPSLC